MSSTVDVVGFMIDGTDAYVGSITEIYFWTMDNRDNITPTLVMNSNMKTQTMIWNSFT